VAIRELALDSPRVATSNQVNPTAVAGSGERCRSSRICRLTFSISFDDLDAVA
jgi:hypothetical protein